MERIDLENFLRRQDKIADYVEDFSVILTLRDTRLHSRLVDQFFELVDQVLKVTRCLLTAAIELQNLAEVSIGGVDARMVMEWLEDIGAEEWKADHLVRKLSRNIYRLEDEIDVLTIIFYEKMVGALGSIANEAENAGDMLRSMMVK